jgi:hypothetical protein
MHPFYLLSRTCQPVENTGLQLLAAFWSVFAGYRSFAAGNHEKNVFVFFGYNSSGHKKTIPA